MINRINLICITLIFLAPSISICQIQPFVVHPDQLQDQKYAYWITHPEITGQEYGVYYFRKEFDLSVLPGNFIINISADNRYKLFVNEKYLTFGPASGDLMNWNYEKINIAGLLKVGKNVISVQVWNWGNGKGPRQISAQTAFILQGESEIEFIINSNDTWKVIADSSYSAIINNETTVRQGYIAGVSEKINGSEFNWDWNKLNIVDTLWSKAKIIGKGAGQGLNTWKGLTPWILKERKIPLMEEKIEDIPKVCYINGNDIDFTESSSFSGITIPKYSNAEILLDNTVLTMGYPFINISGGKKSVISVSYQEALFKKHGTKGNRNIWQNKELKGVKDVYISDGGENRIYEPLWIRVFRYIKISVVTYDEALIIDQVRNRFAAYPLKQKAAFNSDDTNLTDIWDASWRTARLCALETYMDCPYYEQLQYIGDTRIQSLISLFVAGDDRLMKNAIEQFYVSMQPMGLTKSAHPSSGVQIIPPFSLYFVLMLHDYFMYGSDFQFIRDYLPGVRFILDWFIAKIDETGMLGPLPFWNHIDGGTKEFEAGSPPGITEGNSAHMSILLAHTIDSAIELFNYFEEDCEAESLTEISRKLKRSTVELCFDESKGLIAESPGKNLFSQHTNSFAILSELFNQEMNRTIAEKLISDSSLAQTTLYFDFYLFQALKKGGLGENVLDRFDRWKEFLDYGLSTFPEHGIESRSDCHAWSAHPIYDLLNITCGIESVEPGFKSIIISPNPGYLKKISAKMDHPKGEISIDYKRDQSDEEIFSISIPEGVNSTFQYKSVFKTLHQGLNEIKIESRL